MPPPIVHWAASAPPLMLQLKPPLPGKVSLSVTFLASPGPALLTVIVNPIVSPELTGLASLVFVTDRSGHCTVTEAVALLLAFVLDASFVAVAEAVFDTVPQLADEVVAFTCTVVLKPAARVVGV